MSLLARYPVITFGLGVATGYFVHKYRKEIINAANDAAKKSRELVLQQRETLADVLAENKDAGDSTVGRD